MDIKNNHFYFIKESYYELTKNSNMMKNKENGRGRPFFLAIKNYNGIIWMVPVTSKYTKYIKVYKSKIEKHGRCDTLVFGKLLGKKCVFLIQNMFPIISSYIKEEYRQGPKKIPVTIVDITSDEILSKSKKVLALVRSGKEKLVFIDILKIEKMLLEELNNKNLKQ